MRSSSVSCSSSRNGSSHWKEVAAGLSLAWGRALMKRPFASGSVEKLPDKLKRRGNKCNCILVSIVPGPARSIDPGTTTRASDFELLVGDDLDAKARQALVVVHGR